jgi:hypothetical protein
VLHGADRCGDSYACNTPRHEFGVLNLCWLDRVNNGPKMQTDIVVSSCFPIRCVPEKFKMIVGCAEVDQLSRGGTLDDVRKQLGRSITCAESLGLAAVAAHLRLVLDEILQIAC